MLDSYLTKNSNNIQHIFVIFYSAPFSIESLRKDPRPAHCLLLILVSHVGAAAILDEINRHAAASVCWSGKYAGVYVSIISTFRAPDHRVQDIVEIWQKSIATKRVSLEEQTEACIGTKVLAIMSKVRSDAGSMNFF